MKWNTDFANALCYLFIPFKQKNINWLKVLSVEILKFLAKTKKETNDENEIKMMSFLFIGCLKLRLPSKNEINKNKCVVFSAEASAALVSYSSS